MSGYYNRQGFGSMMSAVPPVVKNIILINAIMFIGTMLVKEAMYERLALFPIGSYFFRPYQLVSHMFMHGGIWHLFFNMYTLFFFGSVLERVWGSKKFLLYYMVTGIGAAICHLAVMYLQGITLNIPTVGASGAVYGLLLAYGMLFPNNRLTIIFPVPISLKAKWFVAIFGAIELLTGIAGRSDGIAHFAHLGGMIFGVFLILYWKRKGRMYDEY